MEIASVVQWGLVVLLGLIFGSFSTMLSVRGEVFSFDKKGGCDSARSRCVHCGHRLGVLDLFPLFSWVFLQGRCRYCSEKISGLYPCVELSVVFAGAAYFAIYGWKPMGQLGIAYAAIAILIGLAVCDFKHKVLPNNLILALAVLGLFYRFWPSYIGDELGAWSIEFVGGALVYGLLALFLGALMEKVLGKRALGMGDVKFFAVSGLWLGLSKLGLFCVLGGVLGIVLGVIWQKVVKEMYFPFGPALVASFFAVLLLGGSHIF